MDKKILFLLVAAFTLVVIIGFLVAPAFFGGDRNAPENSQSDKAPSRGNLSSDNYPETDNNAPVGKFTVEQTPDSWQIVDVNEDKVSIKIPGDWQINENTENYAFKAAFNSEKIQISTVINTYDNNEKLTVENWVRQKRGISDFKSITKNALNGVRYISKVSVGKDDSGKKALIAGSYRLSEIFSRNNQIVTFSCSVAGADYKSYILICGKIADSFILK